MLSLELKSWIQLYFRDAILGNKEKLPIESAAHSHCSIKIVYNEASNKHAYEALSLFCTPSNPTRLRIARLQKSRDSIF